jgi:membrane-bound lytic murein transglycosylase
VEDKKFRPSDTGGAIRGQRINLYCGEGSRAEQMTFQITDHNNRPGYS